MTTPMKVISLGWGVQSFALAAMSALGELEPVDAAVHADTTHESKLTYEFAARWTPWLEGHGVRVVTVTSGVHDKWMTSPRLVGHGTPPLFTFGDKKGILNRSCTQRWKITPQRRWLQANRNKRPVEQWFGISLDEFKRMKDSDVKYVKHRWPLIEKRMTRQDCVSWLQKAGIEVPPKSSCTFCPFHSIAEWRNVQSVPEDWAEALAVDDAVRNSRPPYTLYVHQKYIPLREWASNELRNAEQDKDQLSLFSLWDNECAGVCGV